MTIDNLEARLDAAGYYKPLHLRTPTTTHFHYYGFNDLTIPRAHARRCYECSTPIQSDDAYGRCDSCRETK